MAAAFAVLIVFSSTTKGIVESIFAFFGCIPLGYFLGLLYKEMSLKGEYYFYYNRGIGRWELWIVSLLLSCSFVVCSCLIAGLWKLV